VVYLPGKVCIRIVIACPSAQTSEGIVVAKARGVGGVSPVLGKGRVEAEERHDGQRPMGKFARELTCVEVGV
jgi:hypothetical protein